MARSTAALIDVLPRLAELYASRVVTQQDIESLLDVRLAPRRDELEGTSDCCRVRVLFSAAGSTSTHLQVSEPERASLKLELLQTAFGAPMRTLEGTETIYVFSRGSARIAASGRDRVRAITFYSEADGVLRPAPSLVEAVMLANQALAAGTLGNARVEEIFGVKLFAQRASSYWAHDLYRRWWIYWDSAPNALLRIELDVEPRMEQREMQARFGSPRWDSCQEYCNVYYRGAGGTHIRARSLGFGAMGWVNQVTLSTSVAGDWPGPQQWTGLAHALMELAALPSLDAAALSQFFDTALRRSRGGWVGVSGRWPLDVRLRKDHRIELRPHPSANFQISEFEAAFGLAEGIVSIKGGVQLRYLHDRLTLLASLHGPMENSLARVERLELTVSLSPSSPPSGP